MSDGKGEARRAEHGTAPSPVADPRALYERLGCQGRYGFGTGYALAEKIPVCEICPVRTFCWKSHVGRVQTEQPSLVEQYQRLVAEIAHRHGISRDAAHDLCRRELLKAETPDPYTANVYLNMSSGLDRRRIEDGEVRVH